MNTKQRLVLALATAALVVCGWSGTAAAHVLKVDGPIGVVLHIEPDDNPLAGVLTKYSLTFNDESGRFSLQHCDCSVTVLQGAKTLHTSPLAAGSDAVSDNSFTFPAAGVYTLRVSGRPAGAAAPTASSASGDFQPFTLAYSVRVGGGTGGSQPFPPLLWAGAGLAMGLILLAAYAMNYDTSNVKQSSRRVKKS